MFLPANSININIYTISTLLVISHTHTPHRRCRRRQPSQPPEECATCLLGGYILWVRVFSVFDVGVGAICATEWKRRVKPCLLPWWLGCRSIECALGVLLVACKHIILCVRVPCGMDIALL